MHVFCHCCAQAPSDVRIKIGKCLWFRLQGKIRESFWVHDKVTYDNPPISETNTHLQLLKSPPPYVLEHLITGPNGTDERKPI